MFNTIKKYFKTTTTRSISFNYKWTINNFNRLYDEDHPWKWRICSKEFSPSNNEPYVFELYLYPKGGGETLKNFALTGFGINAIPQIYEGKISCQWKVSIEDKNGLRCVTKDMGLYSLFNNQERVERILIPHSSLLNLVSKLSNSQLTLHFEIRLQAGDSIFNVITNNEVGRSQFDCAQKVTKVVHTWTVENFADLFDSNAVVPYLIQSDHFPMLNKQCEQFFLDLHPNGLYTKRNENFDITICNGYEKSTISHMRISILDVDGEECDTREVTRKFCTTSVAIFEFNRDYLLNKSNGLFYEDKLRIYCEISYMTEDKEKAVDHSEMSDIVHKSESSFDIAQKVIHHVSNLWTIDKFSALCLDTTKTRSIHSPIFKLSTDPRFAFHLRLWPSGKHNKESVSLELCKASSIIKKLTVQYKISILSANGDKWPRLAGQQTIVNNELIGDPTFFPRSILQTKPQIIQYLPSDTLTIECELWIVQDRKIFKNNPTDNQSKINSPSGSTALINMPNANLVGVIINILSESSVGDFKVISSSNDDKLK